MNPRQVPPVHRLMRNQIFSDTERERSGANEIAGVLLIDPARSNERHTCGNGAFSAFDITSATHQRTREDLDQRRPGLAGGGHFRRCQSARNHENLTLRPQRNNIWIEARARQKIRVRPETGRGCFHIEDSAGTDNPLRIRPLQPCNRIGRARQGGCYLQDSGETPIGHLTPSFRSLSDETRAMELLNRYESRYSREYRNALACFKNQRADMKRMRKVR